MKIFSEIQKRRLWLPLLGASLISLGIGFVFLSAYIGLAVRTVDTRMHLVSNARSTEFYALYPPFQPKQRLLPQELKAILIEQGYRENLSAAPLSPREFRSWQKPEHLTLELFRPPYSEAHKNVERLQGRLEFEKKDGEYVLTEIFQSDNGQPLEVFENLPKRLGVYFGGRARAQDNVPLSEIPTSARLAVMAIEDVHFLEHKGVSLRSIFRALLKDLRHMKKLEGGSTLTQQLMKNLYFSNEKRFTRKIKEAIYALVTEYRYPKEAILEAYINEVYLGQAGGHELHGFSEGARYFFNRPISQLSLSQSAMLAAIVQAPNSKGPYAAPEKTKERRDLVLRKMWEATFITEEEYETAVQEPLGVTPPELTLSDVYYAIDLVLQRLPEALRTRMDYEPYTVYVTINPYLQGLAARTLNKNLERLKKSSPLTIQREKNGIHLQSALLAVNVKDCTILAIQGGKSYRETQFNRIVQGKRQPGSLFKPFVVLSALANAKNPPITPTTLFEDAPFEWKFDKQVWAPKNYDEKFRGPLTVREALESSQNIPIAKMAQEVGVAKVRETIVKAGITSPIPEFPSIALGAAEVSPIELTEAFTTLANLGKSCKLRPYLEVFDASGNSVEGAKADFQEGALPATNSFQTVNIMKGVFTHGTAKSAQGKGIPLELFAGKTGTTNDGRDAWFVGFSPNLLVLVWVGYDEQEALGLPGAVAALPLWTDFVSNARLFYGTDSFQPPDDLVAVPVDRQGHRQNATKCQDVVVDYFVPGTEPKERCSWP